MVCAPVAPVSVATVARRCAHKGRMAWVALRHASVPKVSCVTVQMENVEHARRVIEDQSVMKVHFYSAHRPKHLSL